MNEPPQSPRSVLVIDDDPLMRELLLALLEIEGITVETAGAGEEAVTRLLQMEPGPEVVLTDLQMPDTDIFRLAPKLRAVRGSRGTKALLLGMSGSPAKSEELSLLDGFLLKPFSTEEFFAAIHGAKRAGLGAEPVHASETPAGISDEENTPVALDTAVYEKLAGSLKPAALAELYRITLEDARQRIIRMRAAYAQGDHETCRREAHAIKGSCGMVGAMELRTAAAALEAGAPADTPALADLEEACQRLQGMLSAPPLVTFDAS